jgi:acyl-CoA reductase-like NAD-dependent aldehyde dehydrogenase
MDHPVNGEADMGTLVSVEAADRVRRQVAEAISAGARLVHDGDRSLEHLPTRAYMGPVVLDQVTHDMEIMREETFGPVAPIMAVKDDDAAISLMNDSHYGLTAAIWTQDIDRAFILGSRIEAGSFAINQCNYADPWLPWGGVKASGMGVTDGDLAYDGVTRQRSVFARHL